MTSALPFAYHIAGPEGEAYGTISEGLGFRDQFSIELVPSEGAAAGDEEAGETAETVEIETADAETAGVTAETTFDPRQAVVSTVTIDAVEEL